MTKRKRLMTKRWNMACDAVIADNGIPTWESDLCDVDPDNCWIDKSTGEHVNATTNKRSKTHEA